MQIGMMGEIYSNAALTIAAGAGRCKFIEFLTSLLSFLRETTHRIGYALKEHRSILVEFGPLEKWLFNLT